MSQYHVDGFKFAGINSGIKKNGHLDLGLIVAEKSIPCAGVFTTNQVVAAPVVQSKERLTERAIARAIIVNSGNANACTGEIGAANANQMATYVAQHLGCESRDVQVCSTGVIGAPLPMTTVTHGIDKAVESLEQTSFFAFAESIRTTDTFTKARRLEVTVDERTYSIVGASKGAGMIHPNMATMLGFVVTDAPISEFDIGALWHRTCQKTFNAITIDGDTSTNDTALFMASGAAGGDPLKGSALQRFEDALIKLTSELAKDIIRDAEGGTKVVEINVTGGLSFDDVQTVANTIALSPLVKTAIHGEDPNWGRIIAAAGRSGIQIDPDRIALYFDDVQLYADGEWRGPDAEKQVHAIMLRDEYSIRLDLAQGEHSHSIFTCDLSADYVRINADYRS